MEELKFKSFEDIVTVTVERTLEILTKDYVLVPRKEWEKSNTYDRKILETLKKFDKPVSLEHLVYETGIEKTRLCKKLKTLQKFGKVRCVTKKVVSYWKIIE